MPFSVTRSRTIARTGVIGSYPAASFPAGTTLILLDSGDIYQRSQSGSTPAWVQTNGGSGAMTPWTLSGTVEDIDGDTTTPYIAWVGVIDAADFPGLELRIDAVGSADGGGHSFNLRLRNLTTDALVAIGEGSKLSTSNPTWAAMGGEDILTATNFDAATPRMYAVEVYSSVQGQTVILGSVQLTPAVSS